MTAMPRRTTSVTEHAPARAEEDTPSVAKAAAWALLGCLTVSLLLLLMASVGGADLRVVRSDGRTVTVTASSVAVTIILAVLAGTLALAAFGRRSRRAWTTVAVGGLVLGLASVAAPLTSEATPLTTFVLVAMHVLSALVWFTVLMSMQRRR